MKTYSGSTSEGYLPANLTGNNGSTAVAPAPEDPTTTFSDHLEQQGSSNTPTPPTAASFAAALANPAPKLIQSASATPIVAAIIPSLSATTPSTVPAGAAANPAVPMTAPTAALLANLAATLASAAAPANPPTNGAPVNTAAKTPKNLAAPEDDTSASTKEDASSTSKQAPLGAPGTFLKGSDLSIMLARSAMLVANIRQGTQTSATATTDAPGTTAASESDATLAADDSPGGPSLSTWGTTKPAGAAPTEKKSASSTSERSFIQADTSASSALGMLLIAPSAVLHSNAQTTNNQLLASSARTTGADVASASSGTLASAGMASGKKENEMNATLDLTDLMASTGTSSAVTRTPADVNILLGTNNDFKDALAQVMHVAELSNLSTTTPPLRVAIEIQTPPGAVVNLYVSKLPDDTYRAQLGTDDVQALHWVQDQIGSLKESTDTGVSVRWLPAQLEAAPSSSSSSSSNGQDSAWNRGGQGWQSSQEQQQQADERRQKRGGYAGLLAPDLSIPFIGALGRAA